MGNPPLLLSRQADRRCKLHLASQRRSVPSSVTASSALSECKFLFSTPNHCRSIRFSSSRAKRFLSFFSLRTFIFALEPLWQHLTACVFLSGYPEHMTLSDFRCHFQALSPPIMKRYASMFVSHDERKVSRLITAALSHATHSGLLNP